MPIPGIPYTSRCFISAAVLSLALLVSEAQAIVLIADFNGPGTVSARYDDEDPARSYRVSTVPYVTYVPSYNSGSAVGAGTIGTTLRAATFNDAQLVLNGSQAGQPGNLRASSNSSNAGALLVMDGGTNSAFANKPSLVLSNGIITNLVNINTSGLNGANLMQGGDIPRGIVFDGLANALSGAATLDLVVFKNDYGTSGQYAYLTLNAADYQNVILNPYVPFTGIDDSYAATHLHFVSSTGNSAHLAGIFQSVGAIAMSINANGGSFNVTLNSIYSHTPEPGSLLIWTGFGLAAAGWRSQRKSTSVSPALSPACV